jgi:subtilisin family serine protease
VPNARARASALAAQYGTATHAIYEFALKGFAATLSPTAVTALRTTVDVKYIELDRQAYLDDVDPTPGWGLDRIDQQYLPLNGTFTSNYNGTGVNVYIVDSGVQANHVDFGSRVQAGWSGGGSPTVPCNGHGTSVAGVAAGSDFGVAKNATIWAVKGTHNCDSWGWVSVWSSAVDWVTGNHVKPAVLNMSVSTDNWVDDILPGSMNDAVKNAKNAGVFVVVSAGNNNNNACGYSPANALEVMTVAASDASDAKASFSNWGGCVDIFAPGVSITTATLGGGYGPPVSGTSFSAPFVAGVGALLLQRFPNDSPDQVHYMIVGGATPVISNPGGAPPYLLYSNLPTIPLASIDGPTLVGYMNSGCQWEAVVRGGRQPYTYQWSGLRTGTQSTVGGPISGSGTLNLDVWDTLGAHAQASLYIEVDPNNPGDPLCTGL